MSTVGEFPAMLAAISELEADNGVYYTVEFAALKIPPAFEQHFTDAEEAARTLRDVSIADYLEAYNDVEAVCERAGHSKDEDALLSFAVGEESVRELISRELKRKHPVGADSLNEVLESAFDGSLCKFWQRKYGR